MRHKDKKKQNSHSTQKNRVDYRISWAKLIWKVYGGDPLTCPACGNKMKICETITKNVDSKLRQMNIKSWYYDDGDVIRKITRPKFSANKTRAQ